MYMHDRLCLVGQRGSLYVHVRLCLAVEHNIIAPSSSLRCKIIIIMQVQYPIRP